MKKILRLAVAFLLIISAFALVACGDGGKTPAGDTEAVIEGSLKINVEEEGGKKVLVGVDEDKDFASYSLIRDDNASKNVKTLLTDVREAIKARTGHTLAIKTTLAGGGKAVAVLLDDTMGIDDYSITSKSGKIYVKAGSEEALKKATDVFVKYFIYSSNKSVLVPAGKGYVHEINYAIEKLTVDGVDITEFKVFSAAENKTGFDNDNFAKEFADIFNASLMEAMGIELEIEKYWNEKNHNIIVRADSLEVNPYSIKIEGGDIYITGSYLSAKKALEALVSDVVGYADGAASKGSKVNLTSADSMEGSLGLTMPYNADELLAMFKDAYGRDDMVLSGTHVWDDSMAGTNGTGVRATETVFEKSGLEIPAIFEIEVTKVDNPDDNYTFEQFDISKLVSEAMNHVAQGGVISMSTHFANPFGPERYTKGWYTGHVGGDAGMKALVTEGTEENALLRASFDTTLRVIKALKDNGIPFMLRPFHEMNADWFWWCTQNAGGIKAESYVNLWKYFYNIVMNEIDVTEIIWAYGASSCGTGNGEILYPYPGDEYVDLVGIDWYGSGTGEPTYNNNNGWEKLMSTGKPVALTEVGPAGQFKKNNADGGYYYDYSGKQLLDDIKNMIARGHKIAYFETWTWNGSIPYYENAKVLTEDPIIFNRTDLASYWANN